MKKLFTLLLISTSAAFATPAIDIDGTHFLLAYSEPGTPAQLKEFVPQGEVIASWTRLVSTRIYREIKEPKQHIAQLSTAYNAKYPYMKFDAYHIKKTDDYAIDFIIPYDNGGYEWNFFRASPSKVKGIVVFQYAIKFVYGNDDASEEAATKAIRAARSRLIPILTGPVIPSEYEANKSVQTTAMTPPLSTTRGAPLSDL